MGVAGFFFYERLLSVAALGASPAQIRSAAAQKVTQRPSTPYPARVPTPGVEPGVSGKEKQFQQSRQFGPGPIKPYPAAPPDVSTRPRGVSAGDGVYRGGWGAKQPGNPPAGIRKGLKDTPYSYRRGETPT